MAIAQGRRRGNRISRGHPGRAVGNPPRAASGQADAAGSARGAANPRGGTGAPRCCRRSAPRTGSNAGLRREPGGGGAGGDGRALRARAKPFNQGPARHPRGRIARPAHRPPGLHRLPSLPALPPAAAGGRGGQRRSGRSRTPCPFPRAAPASALPSCPATAGQRSPRGEEGARLPRPHPAACPAVRPPPLTCGPGSGAVDGRSRPPRCHAAAAAAAASPLRPAVSLPELPPRPGTGTGPAGTPAGGAGSGDRGRGWREPDHPCPGGGRVCPGSVREGPSLIKAPKRKGFGGNRQPEVWGCSLRDELEEVSSSRWDKQYICFPRVPAEPPRHPASPAERGRPAAPPATAGERSISSIAPA